MLEHPEHPSGHTTHNLVVVVVIRIGQCSVIIEAYGNTCIVGLWFCASLSLYTSTKCFVLFSNTCTSGLNRAYAKLTATQLAYEQNIPHSAYEQNL